MVQRISGASSRREQALATRARMIRGALDLLATSGLTATTMAAVASAAGVAVQTVYFTFHTKDDLLRAVFELAVEGDDPEPGPTDWRALAAREPRGRPLLEEVVRSSAATNARVAPIRSAIHAVADEIAGEVPRQFEASRRKQLSDVVDLLARRHQLTHRMSRRRATDVLWTLTGADSYGALVLDSGWTARNWVRWVTDLLAAELLLDEPPS